MGKKKKRSFQADSGGSHFIRGADTSYTSNSSKTAHSAPITVTCCGSSHILLRDLLFVYLLAEMYFFHTKLKSSYMCNHTFHYSRFFFLNSKTFLHIFFESLDLLCAIH